MKKQIKVLLVALLIIPCMVMLAACGGSGKACECDPDHTHEHTHPEYQNPASHTHSYGNEWTTVISATCISQGMEKRVCSCGNMEVRAVAKNGHDMGEWVYTDNTATVNGTRTGICLNECGYTKTEVSATAGLEFGFVAGSGNMQYEVKKYTGSATEVIIPAIHNGKPVTLIGQYMHGGDATWVGAFESTTITSLTIPASVTSFGQHTFKNCTSLTIINFGGTTTQWNAITKVVDWNYHIPAGLCVICTNGTITL